MYDDLGACSMAAVNECRARHQNSGYAFTWAICPGHPLQSSLYCVMCAGYQSPADLFTEYYFCTPLYRDTAVVSEPRRSEHSCQVQGSIIDVDNQSVGEDVAIVGTPFRLMYFSDRVFGRVNNYRIHIPILFDDPSIMQIDVAVTVAGRVFPSQSIPALPNQVYELSWDGLDASNQPLPASTTASVTFKYTYALGTSTGLGGDTSLILLGYVLVTADASDVVTREESKTYPIGTRNTVLEGLGGWSLSHHHHYDVARQQVVFGSGNARTVSAVTLPTGFRVAAEDGAEVYLFAADGRHTQTLHGLTGQALLTFAYNPQGRLVSITDADGNSTTIVRDASGQATGILSPYGQLTTLTIDADGLLSSIQTPTTDTYTMTYWSAAGLLKTFRTPRGLESTFTYDAEGRLVQDANNAAFAWNLALTEDAGIAGPRQITLTSAEGRASRYDVYVPAAGSVERTVTDALGVQTIYAEDPTGRHLTSPAGTLQSATTNDPRFGAQAPYASSVSLSTPGGTQWARTVAQTVTLADPADPFSVQTLAVEATTNGNRSTVVYDGSTRTTTVTTPKGRKAAVTIDSTGRVTSEQLGNRTPVQYTYDARGRLAQVTQGARTTTLTYNPGGFVDTLTDPLGRTTAFEYDAAGRVTRQTLPDGRGIGFGYDADGNLTGLTPPGRTRHHLTRWLQGDLRAYRPPALDEGQPVKTTYTYNRDRQLTRVRRPDGQTIRFTYGATTGALNTITTPQGPRTVLWNGTNGLVSSVTTPGQFTINRGYDGVLLTSENAGSPLAAALFPAGSSGRTTRTCRCRR